MTRSDNQRRATELQDRLVLIRRYAGTKEEVAAAWGMETTKTLDAQESANYRHLQKLAAYADKLGVELHMDIKLPRQANGRPRNSSE